MIENAKVGVFFFSPLMLASASGLSLKSYPFRLIQGPRRVSKAISGTEDSIVVIDLGLPPLDPGFLDTLFVLSGSSIV